VARIVVLGEGAQFKKLFGKALAGEGHTLIYKSSIEETLVAEPHLAIVVANPQAQKRLEAIRKANPELKTILWVPDWTPNSRTPKGAAHLLSGARSVSGMLGAVRGTLILSGELRRLDPKHSENGGGTTGWNLNFGRGRAQTPRHFDPRN
jgi:hypothetical protein